MSLIINDIQNGRVYGIDSLHNHYIDPRDTSLSSKFVRQRSPLYITPDAESPSSKPPTSQIGASAIHPRMSVTEPTPDNESLPRTSNLPWIYSQTTMTPLSWASNWPSLQTS